MKTIILVISFCFLLKASSAQLNFNNILGQSKSYVLNNVLRNYKILDSQNGLFVFQYDVGLRLAVQFDDDNLCKSIIVDGDDDVKKYYIKAFQSCDKRESYYATLWVCDDNKIMVIKSQQPESGIIFEVVKDDGK